MDDGKGRGGGGRGDGEWGMGEGGGRGGMGRGGGAGGRGEREGVAILALVVSPFLTEQSCWNSAH